MATKPTIPDFPDLPDIGNMISQACELIANIRGIPYDFNGTLSLENKFTVLFKTVQEMFKAQDSLVKSYKELYNFINNYFNNLDVQEEVNKKIQSMVEDGSLLSLIAPTISTKTSEWLTTNITNPSNPPIDKSLTVENAAADAKTVGYIGVLSSAQNINDPTFDLNTCTPNRIYIISTHVVNSPKGTYAGILVSFARNKDQNDNIMQFYFGSKNDIFSRYKPYNGVWSEWKFYGEYDETYNFMSSNTNISATTFDLNDCVPNRIYTISNPVVNSPKNTYGGILWSFAKNTAEKDVIVQFFYDTKTVLYSRFKAYHGEWTPWNQYDMKTLNSYYNLSLFTTIGVIGDSYASGEIWYGSVNYGDKYIISWLQQLSRKYGFTGYNFSSGGLTTRSWLTSDKGLALMQTTENCELMLLCLGINDYYSLGESYLGSESDIGTNADTFYGNYSKIIDNVISKNEKTRIILFTLANTDNLPLIEKFNSAIKKIGTHYNIPVGDLNTNFYIRSDGYKQMSGGHPTVVNYNGLSSAYDEIIGDVLYNNQNYFNTLYK